MYRFDRQPQEGVVNLATYLLDSHLELITPQGNLQIVDYAECKALCFASETGRPDLFSTHSLFERRPKTPGLWTRFTFRDGDVLDGMLPASLLEWPSAGYLIMPPQSGAARQRVFIPRRALAGTELKGVVGSSAMAQRRRPGVKSPTGEDDQLTMFE